LSQSVHFLDVFLFLAGPEGLGQKNFKIWARKNYKAGPRVSVLFEAL